MAIRYDFRQARKITADIAQDDREKLVTLCREIKQAESLLRDAAAPLMESCATACQGICCRNIHLDTIIGRGDLVYILCLHPELAEELAARVEKEPLLYSADCVFLQDGVGPCIFPGDAKPQVCLTTFCGDTTMVAREIRLVKRRFRRLDRFVSLHCAKQILGAFWAWMRPGDAGGGSTNGTCLK